MVPPPPEVPLPLAPLLLPAELPPPVEAPPDPVEEAELAAVPVVPPVLPLPEVDVVAGPEVLVEPPPLLQATSVRRPNRASDFAKNDVMWIPFSVS